VVLKKIQTFDCEKNNDMS